MNKDTTASAGNNNSTSQDQPKTAVGKVLAEARMSAGLSVEQVAAGLKITPAHVRTIEAGDHTVHGIAIYRGFVRAYAKLLKIDPEPLVAQLKDAGSQAAKAELTRIVEEKGKSFEPNEMSFRKKPKMTGKIIIALIILAVIGVVVWNVKFAKKGPAKQQEAVVVKEQAPAPATPPAEEAKPDQAQAPADGAKPADPAQAMTPAEKAKAEAAKLEAEKAKAAQPAATGTKTISVTFSDRSVVSVRKKSNGQMIASWIGKAGETKEVQVSEPVKVYVSQASAVRMRVNGAPFELKSPMTGSPIANVIVQ